MQAFLKEFFGGEHKDYAQVFQAIDVPRFLIEGHTKIMQIRRDFELSETAHHAQVAYSG